MILFVMVILVAADLEASDFESNIVQMLDIPNGHLGNYFYSYKNLRKDFCLKHAQHEICEKNHLTCWGYEVGCTFNDSYHSPKCPGDYMGWVKSKVEQYNTFYNQADFGYVKKIKSEVDAMCEPWESEDSSLECSKNAAFCRGKNIYMDFTNLPSRKEQLRYNMDILGLGQVGGYCNLDVEKLKQEMTYLSPLQSWGPEMRHFVSLPKRPIPDMCDVVINKTTYIMKIDATVNMYHHFCDFFNLYATLHVNANEHMYSRDIDILIWESYTYSSAFKPAFGAFTKNNIMDLKDVSGKRICFKNVVFPLLPRMIFGLYYNTPIISGCEGSGLFRAFSEFTLHRLGVKEGGDFGGVRVLFLSRDTPFRKVLNERQLLASLSAPGFIVRREVFDRNVPFSKQLEIVRNADILVGMHGAGLTHLLFLPDWAVVFELYNCEDANCYFDLARLRGVKYITWQNKSTIYPDDEKKSREDEEFNAKFTNYKFGVKDFKTLMDQAAEHVLNHPAYNNRKMIRRKTGDVVSRTEL